MSTRRRTYVGAKLDDDTYIDGRLESYNVAADEDPDREIVLREPMFFTVDD